MESKATENFVFFLDRVGSVNKSLIDKVLKHIAENKYVEKAEFRDHIVLMQMANTFDVEVPILW